MSTPRRLANRRAPPTWDVPPGAEANPARHADRPAPARHLPAPTRGAEMALQGADAVADRGGGHAELPARQHEALVPGGGLEEAQAVERGQVEHGGGP